jgi:hypothetical protein
MQTSARRQGSAASRAGLILPAVGSVKSADGLCRSPDTSVLRLPLLLRQEVGELGGAHVVRAVEDVRRDRPLLVEQLVEAFVE